MCCEVVRLYRGWRLTACLHHKHIYVCAMIIPYMDSEIKSKHHKFSHCLTHSPNSESYRDVSRFDHFAFGESDEEDYHRARRGQLEVHHRDEERGPGLLLVVNVLQLTQLPDSFGSMTSLTFSPHNKRHALRLRFGQLNGTSCLQEAAISRYEGAHQSHKPGRFTTSLILQ